MHIFWEMTSKHNWVTVGIFFLSNTELWGLKCVLIIAPLEFSEKNRGNANLRVVDFVTLFLTCYKSVKSYKVGDSTVYLFLKVWMSSYSSAQDERLIKFSKYHHWFDNIFLLLLLTDSWQQNKADLLVHYNLQISHKAQTVSI